jgi:hypothetical protein
VLRHGSVEDYYDNTNDSYKKLKLKDIWNRLETLTEPRPHQYLKKGYESVDRFKAGEDPAYH